MPSLKSPPVIDFSDFLSGDAKRMQHVADQIHEACTTQGFFQIVNHGITLQLQRDIMKASKEFFALDKGEKMKLDKSKNKYNRGYEVMHGQMIEANTRPDLKEGYYVSRDLPLDHPQVKAEKFAHGPNVWPESLGEPFRKICMDYLDQITKLTEEVLRATSMSLGYDASYFDEFCKDPMCFYKMLHYPPQPPDAHALQRGIGAHRDFGVITLLLQGDVAGLEVWDDEAKDWYPCPPVEGAYVVNMGNLFEQWTNDVYISNVHRVINRSGTERYSIPFNYNGNPDFIIKCLDKCRAKSDDEKYAPVSVEDYVVQKYKDVYSRAGVYNQDTFAPVKTAVV
ncbi:uncharacterized protein LMH87_007988 [Akanthomyces muscarius]|uniref:Fe2OG dioxygenase domain-containing protein n=1 Tax=Akanthomyces muscarius TaxID=2231603 RepID=A0A9W8QJA9_AKAMU|nr:uncharacterized protein LMH87_007988 [Akanthomyces muscarius]KAJ4160056.1 hypothetical protein LMH87_007988 [Akanthomyces muscarius]